MRDPELAISSIEYALLGALVALGLIVGATALGTELGTAYDDLSTAVEDAFTP